MTALADSSTMARRVLRHTTRNPSALIMAMVLPLVLLLLMNYAFGGALNTGGVKYIDYVVPGIILMAVTYSAQSTAIAVNTDMTQGIIDRFRTMAIARSAVLTGHVVGSTIRSLIGITGVVLVALAIGFRPAADPLHWLAVLGLVTLALFALAWIATAIGLIAANASAAAGMVAIITLLPFLSGAFVPTSTMPGWLRAFTANQPLTQVVEALRGLLLNRSVGDHVWLAALWCTGIALAGFLWARTAFARISR